MAEQQVAPVKGGAVPYLTVEGAIKASKFYEKAFGAEVAASHPPDDKGRTMHVHLYVNGSSVMLSDAYPDHGHPFVPLAGFSIVLIVNDVDSWYSRAVAVGCMGTMLF
jgi:PhnB protein